MEPDHRRTHEIPESVDPLPPLPAPAGKLAVGDQPMAFGYCLPCPQSCGKIGIGTPGFWNREDQAA